MKRAIRRAERQLEETRRQLAAAEIDADDAEMRAYLSLQAELSLAEKEQKRARNARAKTPKNPGVIRRYERARKERERLEVLVKSHPRHGEVASLERFDPETIALLRKANKLEATVQQGQQECDRDAAETAEAVRAVLRRLGYVNRRGLTRKARGLREIVAAPGIVLSEMYEQGLFDRLDAAELAEAVSWFASDTTRKRQNDYWLPRGLNRLRREASGIFARIANIEEEEGIELAQGPSSWFFGVALAWCRGDSIEEITSNIDLGEGDIVSVLNKTVDLLDQFESMLERYGDVDLLHKSAEARRLLVRGLVAMVRSGDRFLTEMSA
jgi:superfamily II RNA helicase